LDVLFCTTSVASIVFFYCPIKNDQIAQLIILTIGLLITPVVNDPTNAFNIIITSVISVIICFGFWAIKILPCSGKFINIFGFNISLPSFSGLSTNKRNRNVEMNLYSSVLSSEDSKSDFPNVEKEELVYGESFPVFDIKSFLQSFRTYSFELRYFLIGIILAVSGFTCFIMQTRESYWYTHSFWHIFVMLSSYFLLRGKQDCFKLINYTH
jgi:hypothetical protein